MLILRWNTLWVFQSATSTTPARYLPHSATFGILDPYLIIAGWRFSSWLISTPSWSNQTKKFGLCQCNCQFTKFILQLVTFPLRDRNLFHFLLARILFHLSIWDIAVIEPFLDAGSWYQDAPQYFTFLISTFIIQQDQCLLQLLLRQALQRGIHSWNSPPRRPITFCPDKWPRFL